MIAPRDLAILITGAIAAVSGVLAAVEVNSLPAPATDAAAHDPATPADATAETPPTVPSSTPGAIPSAIRDVLGSVAGAASVPLDQDALAQHVPPSISAVLSERGAVLVIPPDAGVVP